MFFALVVGFATLQTPKTFQDIEIAKIMAFHGLVKFKMDLTVSFDIGTSKAVTNVETILDGNHRHVKISLPDSTRMEYVDNGSTIWFINHSLKSYVETKYVPEASFDPKANLLKVAPLRFDFNFSSDQPVQFASDPPPIVQSISIVRDGGSTLRKVVASCTSKKGHKITITQWFLPNRWIVKRFEVVGQSDSGPFTGKGEAKIDFNSPPRPREFEPPKDVSTYKKVEQHPGGS